MKTTYTARLCTWDSDKVYCSDYPVAFETTNETEMTDWLNSNYPNRQELKTMSEKRKEVIQNHQPFIHVVITPQFQQSYISEYSFS